MPELPYIDIAPFLPAVPHPIELFTTPAHAHTLIGMGGMFFLMTSAFSVLLLGKAINWGEVQELLAPSLVGVAIGALTAGVFPPQLLYWLVVIFLGVYILKLTDVIQEMGFIFKSTSVVGAVTGLVQGLGMSAATARTGLLYAKKYSLATAWSTTALIGMANFGMATILRLSTGQVEARALVPVIFYTIVPIFIYKFGERYAALNLHRRYVKPLILILLSVAVLGALTGALSIN